MNRRRLLKIVLALPLVKLSTGLSYAAEVAVDLASVEAPWSSLEFEFPQAQGPRASIPAIAVRLPASAGKGGDLFVASRTCPHEGCELIYFKDPSQVLEIFKVRAENPVLGCPCHFSVFDLNEGGKVINGPAPRGPAKFRFRIEGKKLIVLALES